MRATTLSLAVVGCLAVLTFCVVMVLLGLHDPSIEPSAAFKVPVSPAAPCPVHPLIPLGCSNRPLDMPDIQTMALQGSGESRVIEEVWVDDLPLAPGYLHIWSEDGPYTNVDLPHVLLPGRVLFISFPKSSAPGVVSVVEG